MLSLRWLSGNGFSRWALLTWIFILFVLGAFFLSNRVICVEHAERNWTLSTHAAIIAALSAYHEKYGTYPEALAPDEKGEFSGTMTKRGSAHMLYQAITADGNSAIKLEVPTIEGVSESNGRGSTSGRPSTLNGSFLAKSAIFPRPDALPAGTIQPRLIVDGWGRPFQYTKADPDPSKNKAVNTTTYDLWSVGYDPGKEAPPDDLGAKRDENVSGKWIKNW